MTRYLSNVVIVLSLMVLVGCGFHLRGAVQLPDSLKTIYIDGLSTKRGLGRTLKQNLVSNDIVVLNSYEKGSAVLKILDNKFERRVLSVGSNAKVSEYELHGLIRYSVIDANQQTVIDSEEVEAQRDYQFDQDDVLGKAEEERSLREQLDQQLVRAIMRRLSTLK